MRAALDRSKDLIPVETVSRVWDASGIPRWSTRRLTLFQAEVRRRYLQMLSVDEAAWRRARGARVHGVQGYWYCRTTNPEFARNALRTPQEVSGGLATEAGWSRR